MRGYYVWAYGVILIISAAFGFAVHETAVKPAPSPVRPNAIEPCPANALPRESSESDLVPKQSSH
jgi:hypothetical protein